MTDDTPSRRADLSVDARLAVLEVGQGRLENEFKQDRDQRDREHQENRGSLQRIEEALAPLAGMPNRVKSLETTRDVQDGVLKTIKFGVAIAAASSGIVLVVTAIVTVVRLATMGHP